MLSDFSRNIAQLSDRDENTEATTYFNDSEIISTTTQNFENESFNDSTTGIAIIASSIEIDSTTEISTETPVENLNTTAVSKLVTALEVSTPSAMQNYTSRATFTHDSNLATIQTQTAENFQKKSNSTISSNQNFTTENNPSTSKDQNTLQSITPRLSTHQSVFLNNTSNLTANFTTSSNQSDYTYAKNSTSSNQVYSHTQNQKSSETNTSSTPIPTRFQGLSTIINSKKNTVSQTPTQSLITTTTQSSQIQVVNCTIIVQNPTTPTQLAKIERVVSPTTILAENQTSSSAEPTINAKFRQTTKEHEKRTSISIDSKTFNTTEEFITSNSTMNTNSSKVTMQPKENETFLIGSWTKTEILILLGITFVLNVVSLVIVVACVYRIASRRFKWDRPPLRYDTQNMRISRPIDYIRPMHGVHLATDKDCTYEENPTNDQTDTYEAKTISKNDGWCVPYTPENNDVSTEDTGV